jgi:hypothetical protein
MGIEFDDFNLLDVYAKTNTNKISQKYGGQLTVVIPYDKNLKLTDGSRTVVFTKGWVEPKSNSEEDQQEEKLLDEQKQIQSLHD